MELVIIIILVLMATGILCSWNIIRKSILNSLRNKKVSDIRTKITVLETKVEVLKSINLVGTIIGILVPIVVLIFTLLNNYTSNMKDVLKMYNNNNSVVNVLMNDSISFNEKNNLLHNIFENASIDTDDKVLNDIRKDIKNIVIDSKENNSKAIELVIREDNQLSKYSGNSIIKLYKEIDIFDGLPNMIYLIIVIVYILYTINWYYAYELKIYKEYVEINKIDFKNRILMKIYQLYQKDSKNVVVKNYYLNLDNKTFNEAIGKLINENMILEKEKNNYIISLEGIKYIEEFIGIDKHLDSKKKVELIERFMMNIDN
ncbi:MAG: hypothetical protein E7A11_17850 [Clostridium sp.]|nr:MULTISPECIES: hypothetical protein [Clostridium]MDU1096453.1 hypothetical protein [Clostridioides difficile]MDB2122046.1 hypothetical protein [Clostridium paraputrificum]MDU1127118.1 hypothetical protein [Clostridium sp.]MDU2756446.1 hypothetical protein [Clostridium sp.]MDU2902007.1 hypothetical protein [Clostridium sp.]